MSEFVSNKTNAANPSHTTDISDAIADGESISALARVIAKVKKRDILDLEPIGDQTNADALASLIEDDNHVLDIDIVLCGCSISVGPAGLVMIVDNF